jgi:ABC-type branched-subunit amino acid transport system substrate-binding protein
LYILAQSIQKAGTTDPDAVAAALMQTDYNGVYGRHAFVTNHDPRLQGYLVPQITQARDVNGEISWQIVYPANQANATAINPATGKPYP